MVSYENLYQYFKAAVLDLVIYYNFQKKIIKYGECAKINLDTIKLCM